MSTDKVNKKEVVCGEREFPNETMKTGKGQLGPEDFELLKVLGRGGCGKVFLVRKVKDQDARKIFAMKVLRKAFLADDTKAVEQTKAERNVLGTLKHPFLVELNYAFQTKSKLYMVMEFMAGADLYTRIKRMPTMTEDAARFYLAETLLAIRYLHKNNIIHRDIKPSNILLGHHGHVKLADHGLCKQGITAAAITHTFSGTPVYMAPEIITDIGHGMTADFWSFGVLAYKCLTRKLPFTAEEEVVQAPLDVPGYLSVEACSLLKRLLKKSALQRLGRGHDGAYKVMHHIFFESIDWDDCINLHLKPPYKCDNLNEEDTTHFPDKYTQMDLMEYHSSSSDGMEVVEAKNNLFEGFEYGPVTSSL